MANKDVANIAKQNVLSCLEQLFHIMLRLLIALQRSCNAFAAFVQSSSSWSQGDADLCSLLAEITNGVKEHLETCL